MVRLIALLAFVLAFVAAPLALAAGRVELVPVKEGQARGPLELTRTGTSYEGAFEIRNVGSDPLLVSRVAPRTEADDVRLPRKVSARLESGRASTTIAPGESARVRVVWAPDRGSRVRSFYGHVVVTSTDEVAGEVAMGIHAQDVAKQPLGELGRHVLSAMVLAPLAGAVLLAFVLLAVGEGRTGRRARVVALAATLASAGLALLAWAWLDPELGRADGGDGLQLVERAVLARSVGVELFLGVDGASLPFIVLAALAAPCGVLASWDQRKSPSTFFALYMLLCSASLGAFVALDIVVWLGCMGVALTAGYLLLGLFGRDDSRVTAGRFLVFCGLGLSLVAIALTALHAHGDRTFLVDGSTAARSWAIPELGRVGFVSKHVTFLGAPLVKSSLCLTFVGLALVAGVFPGHVWLGPALSSAPPAVAAMLVVGVSRAALLAWLRIDVGVLPEAIRWSAPVVGAIACAGALYGALAAMGQRDLLRMVAFGIVASSSVAMLGTAALTPEGLLGFVHGAATSGAAGAAAIIALGALRQRTGTLTIRELRGLGIEAPVLAAALSVAVLGVGALPGCASFWGAWLVTLGLVPREPGLAIAAAVASILLASAMALPLLSVVRGRLPERLRASDALSPFGGHVPELRPTELAALLPQLLIVVLLGFYPGALLGKAATTVRDYGEVVDPEGPTKISLVNPASEDEEGGPHDAVVDRRLAITVGVESAPVAQAEAQAWDRVGE